jgi:membrane fusion protein (multidrug efflux system)
VDGQWLVSEGLKPGQRVVVEGFQKFAVGDAVTAMPWKGTEYSDATGGLSRAQR